MATGSPALSNTSANTTSNTGVASSAAVRTTSTTTTPMVMSNSINTSKNLRGLNKPKCIKCGNVARSRCPYQACKSCCAKAQNPCHIHVLKGNSSFPDKTPSSSTSSLTFQHSNETSSSGNAHRVTSLRQLSNNFAQFNNLQSPLRARKPLTRKEASQINEWRFSKLKEYKDRNIETENESFDRYLQNMSLLEDVFALKGENNNNNNRMMVSKLKMIKSENSTRDRMRFIVNNSLENLETERESQEAKKARYSGLVELNKKLTNARTDEDLKSCRLLKSQLLFNRRHEISSSKWFSTNTIDHEALAQTHQRFNDLKDDMIQQL